MSKKNKSHYDLIVMGAGIAGLSVAYSAIRAGLKTAVTDRDYPGSGASGAPKALLNPATGRKAKKTWNAEECLPYNKKLLETVQSFTGIQFYTNNGVIRPALDEKLAKDMHRTFTETSWPAGWVEWMDRNCLRRRFPGLFSRHGGLWIPAGGTVSLGHFIHAFTVYLKHLGVTFYLYSETNAEFITSPWQIRTRDSQITADHLVYATGESIVDDPQWNMLSLNKVKGQTLTLHLSKQLSFESSVSSLGYIAQMGGPSDSIVLGSTYEHDFNHRDSDKQGGEYLLDRLGRTIPGIRQQIQGKSEGWAGIRVTSSDKRPFIGRHPDHVHLFAIGALGSKGLMLGPWLGKCLVEIITSDKKAPDKFRIDRLYRHDLG